jgi:Flp pilus assembly pilin Flp
VGPPSRRAHPHQPHDKPPYTNDTKAADMHTLTDYISKLRAESGQTMTEYTVILGLIVLVTVAAFTQLGDAIESAINTVRATL